MALFQHIHSGNNASGETWSFSLWFNDPTLPDLDNEIDAGVAWQAAFWTSAGSTFPSAVDQTLVTVKEITQATGGTFDVRQQSVATGGTSGGSITPNDCAVVVSLTTQSFTRSGRGRFYLPNPVGSAVSSSGLLTSTAQSAILGAVQAAMAAADIVAGGDKQPVVYSRVNRTVEAVTGLRVGNHVDTQRRRDNSPETYVSGGVL